MEKIKIWKEVLFVFLLLFFQDKLLAQRRSQPNVLFIAVDDLNDWVGPLDGYKGVKTPNIDKLAKQGMNFTRAYCSAPLCNPSRASLLTGIRPYTSGVYNNAHPFRKVLPDAITLPQYFTSNGYEVFGAGKIFHEAYYDSASWPVPFPRQSSPTPANSPVNGMANFDWSGLAVADSAMADYKIVEAGIDFLNKKHDKPFFLAIGMGKPHLPWYVPQRYFDLYPLSEIVLPKTMSDDSLDLPVIAKRMAASHGEVNYKGDLQQFVLENKQWQKAVQGYLACISFADAQIGRLLEALGKSSYDKNTIIVFFGDHGYNLGEKRHWTKAALWERTTHVPFIIIAPGITKMNSTCKRTVNLMDIYPTLITLCNFPKKENIEANDITALLKNPTLEWDHPSITTMGRTNHAIRTERWRYIRYNDGGEELYDHDADPNEWHNLAKDPKYAGTIKKLSGWLPTTNAAPAPAAIAAPASVRE
jgi:arylsulfatase A-like enzyme